MPSPEVPALQDTADPSQDLPLSLFASRPVTKLKSWQARGEVQSVRYSPVGPGGFALALKRRDHGLYLMEASTMAAVPEPWV